jgi:hypothetical protein
MEPLGAANLWARWAMGVRVCVCVCACVCVTLSACAFFEVQQFDDAFYIRSALKILIHMSPSAQPSGGTGMGMFPSPRPAWRFQNLSWE